MLLLATAVLGRCPHEELHVVLQRCAQIAIRFAIYFNSCIVLDKKFLAFFFKRLRNNNTDRYTEDFPYVSLCGPERNFVKCDDLPIVFTKVVQKKNSETGKIDDWFGYAHAEELLMVHVQ